ncbi:MAG: hypothetical protein IJN59_02690, partial [Oscillospiraceae bacterium]|nr:hypothetical protein [Oscillospiraceae bacterium]
CDDDGAIHALTSSATQSVSNTTDSADRTLTTSTLDATNLTPKAFVISDWSNRVAISEMYSAE